MIHYTSIIVFSVIITTISDIEPADVREVGDDEEHLIVYYKY